MYKGNPPGTVIETEYGKVIKMICIGYICDGCKHLREKIDGWKPACDAFPAGIPNEHALYANRTDTPICNDGIGFESENDN